MLRRLVFVLVVGCNTDGDCQCKSGGRYHEPALTLSPEQQKDLDTIEKLTDELFDVSF